MVLTKIKYLFKDIAPNGSIFRKNGQYYMKISKEAGGYNAIHLEDGEPVSIEQEAEISIPKYRFEVII